MTEVDGLPAHVLLVHFLVVLIPLSAVLITVCAFWPTARRQLTWFTLLLAIVTTALTPVTTQAGEWLYGLRHNPSHLLREHAALGGSMIYFSAALLVAACAVAILHMVERRSNQRRLAANVIVAIVAFAVAISSLVQVYRVGDAGAQSVWGGEIARLTKTHGAQDQHRARPPRLTILPSDE